MKKIICLVVVILMIAAVAYAAKKVAINTKNVASLKGTWTGMISFGLIEVKSSPATLEILNDTTPLKAKLTITDVPEQIANQLSSMGGKQTVDLDDGVITSQGTLMWTGPAKNFLEVTLRDDKKLSVWYYFRGMKGDATLKKK